MMDSRGIGIDTSYIPYPEQWIRETSAHVARAIRWAIRQSPRQTILEALRETKAQ